jgi:hypothetical protein
VDVLTHYGVKKAAAKVKIASLSFTGRIKIPFDHFMLLVLVW